MTKELVQTPVTPMDLLRIATEKDVDIEKLEKLMDLKSRHDSEIARTEFTKAMATFQSACPPIYKTQNSHHSKYAGLAQTIDEIQELMKQCGFSHSWKASQDYDKKTVTITCNLWHVAGHKEEASYTGPLDAQQKNALHQLGSTASYLERYTLFMVLGLAAQDMDTDGISRKKHPDLDELYPEDVKSSRSEASRSARKGAQIPDPAEKKETGAEDSLKSSTEDFMLNYLDDRGKKPENKGGSHDFYRSYHKEMNFIKNEKRFKPRERMTRLKEFEEMNKTGLSNLPDTGREALLAERTEKMNRALGAERNG